MNHQISITLPEAAGLYNVILYSSEGITHQKVLKLF
jgi:hypothetical protein